MTPEEYEQVSSREKDDARAMRTVVNQIRVEYPESEVTETLLFSRTAPLNETHLRLKGIRRYIIATVQSNERTRQLVYRTWQDGADWYASLVQEGIPQVQGRTLS